MTPSLAPTRRDLLAGLAGAGLGLGAEATGAPGMVYGAADLVDSVGVNMHLGNNSTPYVPQFDRVVLPAIDELGVMHAREDVSWFPDLKRKAPEIQRLRTLGSKGITFSVVCFDRLNGYIFTPPESLPDIFEALDGRIDIFEGSNEPNLQNSPARAAISAEHQAALYRTVKASPDLKGVKLAGPSYVLQSREVARNLSRFVDYGNIHPYPGNEHPEAQTPGGLQASMDASRRIFGDAPMIVTEDGYHTALRTPSFHFPVSEAIKARYLPRMLLWNFINGVPRTYLYEFMSSFAPSDTNVESRFGLVGFGGDKTPSFYAVKSLLDVFSDKAPGGRRAAVAPTRLLVPGPGLQTASFRRADGANLFAIWLAAPGWDSGAKAARPMQSRKVRLALAGAAGMARAHRIGDDGQRMVARLNPVGGMAEIDVADNLTVIETW